MCTRLVHQFVCLFHFDLCSNVHRTDMYTSGIFQQRVNEAFSMYCDDEDTGKKVVFNKDHMEGMI